MHLGLTTDIWQTLQFGFLVGIGFTVGAWLVGFLFGLPGRWKTTSDITAPK